ncbi:MAG: ATP-binding protein [Armatimonadota bacterium]|nr:ATP-binding protein [Armatimonadota bacterium]MDR7451441.1 ATP-binding protein [Armatimonadota bacterium]MDR7466409.1 ATP-binding protein [Armatimonadota bacterium]MDR7493131.1 ATP-binding protein [Armatimonadota bacterium]MDR7498112.1 ATP-binding protein [Armatimonadota bacterium]
MTSLRVRLVLVLVLVAWLSVGVVGLVTARLAERRVSVFLQHARAMPGMSAMMRSMMVAPEQRLLGDVRRAIWVAAGIGLLVAAAVGTAVARTIAAPLRTFADAAARLGRGDLRQTVPETGGEELARAARAFNVMAGSLRQAEEVRRQLLVDIAHELGTPLAVLQANMEGMLDGVVPVSAERLASLHAQTQLLTRLVRDLRDLALAQEGQLPLSRHPLDLAALAGEVVEAARPRAAGKALVLDLPPAPLRVTADRDRIAQVLHNLLDNAIRYTPAGGTVRLAASPHGGEVQVEVSDTGPGIPEEELPRIFDRFHRVDRSRSRATGGAGLGLAIVKHLVEAHGGRVWATSRPGAGTTVGFTLPAT